MMVSSRSLLFFKYYVYPLFSRYPILSHKWLSLVARTLFGFNVKGAKTPGCEKKPISNNSEKLKKHSLRWLKSERVTTRLAEALKLRLLAKEPVLALLSQ